MAGFRRPRRYPERPGWKDTTVSRDNVLKNKGHFNNMQQLVFDLFSSGFVGTADDAAERLKISAFSARPRCTELIKLGLLTRLRIDRSIPGRHAWVLGLAPPVPPVVEEEPDLFGDGQPDEQQEWHDYDPDC